MRRHSGSWVAGFATLGKVDVLTSQLVMVVDEVVDANKKVKFRRVLEPVYQ